MSINYQGSGGGVPRKTAKIFGKNAASNDMTVFGSTLGGNTIYSTDLDSIQSAAYETGWRDAVISNLNYPLLSDMNAVQHTLSQQIAYTLQHGIPEYDSGTTYYAYDKVQWNDIIYTALQDNFSNINPSNTSYWAVYYNPGMYANVDLSNLSSLGEKHFINKQQISNCVLEAPNGVMTSSGNTVTIHNGLKVLVPNGRDANNQLVNIEYTLPNDISYSRTAAGVLQAYIFIDIDNLIVQVCPVNATFTIGNYTSMQQYTGYIKDKFVYVEDDNMWYITSDYGTTWAEAHLCPVGRADYDVNNTIIAGGSDSPITLMSSSVESSLYLTKLALPTKFFNSVIPLTWNNATTWDISAPCDGYFAIDRNQSSGYDFICFQQVFENGSFGLQAISTSNSTNSSGFHLFMPAQKGQVIRVSHNGSGAVNLWCFVPAKGNE